MKLIVRETQGILRVEIRVTKPKSIRNYTDETDITGQITKLMEDCQDIFMDTFVHVFLLGIIIRKIRL